MHMDNLAFFNNDGIEVYVDTATGESFCSVSGYARMSGKDRSVIQKRLKACAVGQVKTTEILTKGGLQGCALITEDLVTEWLPKDKPEAATKLLKLGVRHFMHELAGYKVKSEAIKPATQAELILLLAQQNVEIERRLHELEQQKQLQQAEIQCLEKQQCLQQAKTERLEESLEAQEKWLTGVDAELERLNSSEGHYFTVIGFASIHGIKIGKQQANDLGRKASAYCRKNGMRKESVYDSMFGAVGNYPPEALNFVFTVAGLL